MYHPRLVVYENKLLGLSQLHYLLAFLQYDFINTTQQCSLSAAHVSGRAVTEMLPRTLNCCHAAGIFLFSL
jgi:hypothetical protein